MPMTGVDPKEDIEAEYNTIKELQENCESCKLFKNKTADEVFIYKIFSEYETEDGKAMVAIARYGEIYAIHPPKYLTGEQWVVLEFFLRNLEPNDRLVVFSQETFVNLGRYSYGKQLNVQLCVWLSKNIPQLRWGIFFYIYFTFGLISNLISKHLNLFTSFSSKQSK